MDVETAARERRSIRRYQQTPVPVQTLYDLADVGRLYASVANLQPIGFAVVSQKANTDAVFESLNWAMYLKDFRIEPEHRPPAYLLLLTEGRKDAAFDAGGAAATVMLAAKARGLDTCCLGIARSESLRDHLGLTEPWVPAYAIAVGFGAQKSRAVPFEGTVQYWLDENGDFCVPKKSLNDVLIFADVRP